MNSGNKVTNVSFCVLDLRKADAPSVTAFATPFGAVDHLINLLQDTIPNLPSGASPFAFRDAFAGERNENNVSVFSNNLESIVIEWANTVYNDCCKPIHICLDNRAIFSIVAVSP
jgi:hypothetical protein